jgi:hypothetical protein
MDMVACGFADVEIMAKAYVDDLRNGTGQLYYGRADWEGEEDVDSSTCDSESDFSESELESR